MLIRVIGCCTGSTGAESLTRSGRAIRDQGIKRDDGRAQTRRRGDGGPPKTVARQ